MGIANEKDIFEFIVKISNDLICCIDENGTIVNANKSFTDVFTQTDDIRKVPFINEAGFDFNWEEFLQKKPDQQPQSYRLSYYNTKNEWLYFNLKPQPFTTGDTKFEILFFNDITAQVVSEKQYQMIVKHLQIAVNNYPIMVLGFNKQGIVHTWNEKCEAVTGFSFGDINGKQISSFIPFFDSHYLQTILNSVQDETYLNFGQIEEDFKCKDGTSKTIIWMVRFDNQLNKENCLYGLGFDITEKVNSQKALQKSEHRFYTISKATNDAVWDWDLSTNELAWNDGITNIFGFPATEVTNHIKWWEDNIYEEDRDRVVERINRFVELKEIHWSDEYRFMRKDGSYAYVFDKGLIMCDENGIPYRMIGGIIDITDRKIFEQNLVLKNRQLSEFAFFNSHKLRAPLTRLMGIAYLLKSENLFSEADHKELFEKIIASAEELDRMTKDMSNLLI